MRKKKLNEFDEWVRTSLLGGAAFDIALVRLLVKKKLITEQEILDEMRAVQARHPQEDISLAAFTEADCRSDGAAGWHAGGSVATRRLARMARISARSVVLDVGSALGGSARQLAETLGCRVTGLDADFIRVMESTRRTKAMALDEQVTFMLGNAFRMPFADGSFDVVWRQCAPITPFNEDRLLRECARVLKKGGVLACQQGMRTEKLKESDTYNDPELSSRMTPDEYVYLMEKAGLKSVKVDTKTPTRYDIAFYKRRKKKKYVKLYEQGKLLGTMLVAKKA